MTKPFNCGSGDPEHCECRAPDTPAAREEAFDAINWLRTVVGFAEKHHDQTLTLGTHLLRSALAEFDAARVPVEGPQ